MQSEERERIATIESLKALFAPRSVAVVGASRQRGSIGHRLFQNLLHHGFAGVVYPVNCAAQVVSSVRAYASVLDIPDSIDLAIIAVPTERVLEVVEQCGRKGVRGLVVVSAGFKELGGDGAAREAQLLEMARSYGMRLVGPNCMGVINTDSQVSLNATFAPRFPLAGNIGLSTESGAVGLAILDYAHSLNMGISTFASIGNRADVSSNDLLEYWAQDPATKVIVLYLESFGNPWRFARIARQVSATKPIIAVKSGRTPAGLRAAQSHTGALATTEVASEALFRHVGIIRTDTLEELFDVANLLAHQPIPRGRRVVILTNGGGPGILTADACTLHGLEVSPLSQNTIEGLRSFLPSEAPVGNPVDMMATATPEDYARALRLLAIDDTNDAVIALFVPAGTAQREAVAAAIREVAPQFRSCEKPLLACLMSTRGAQASLGSPAEGYVPSFMFPEDAAQALARACQYGEWCRRPRGKVPQFADIDRHRGRQAIAAALAKDAARPLWMRADAIAELLAAYGIAYAPSVVAREAREAAEAAQQVGFPVALKLLSSTISHKTDVGGVFLDLRSQAEVAQAFVEMERRLAALGRDSEMEGATVQKMVPGGVEVVVGVVQDPTVGHLVMFGLGGVYTELMQDVTFALHPLTDVDASEMIRSVRAGTLLAGFRGAPPADIAAVEEVLLRVSAMLEDIPEIAEMDLNPVKAMARGEGCIVVDARLLLS